jgi:hypothetical protein
MQFTGKVTEKKHRNKTRTKYVTRINGKKVDKRRKDNQLSCPTMEINPSISPVNNKKENMPGCRGSELNESLATLTNSLNNGVLEQMQDSLTLQQQIMQLQHEQQLRQQMLVEQFQNAQHQLTQQYEEQLQQLKENIEHQRIQEEEQRVEMERMEREKLDSIKHKDESQYTAIPSSAVKTKLQDYLRNKMRQSDSSTLNLQTNFNNWKQSDSSVTNNSGTTPPSIHPYNRHTAEHFPPLRKTVQSVENNSSEGGTPESGPSTPPNGTALSSNNIHTNPIQEESNGSTYSRNLPIGQGSVPDLPSSLYTSPSLPNINLQATISAGRPPPTSQTNNQVNNYTYIFYVQYINIPPCRIIQNDNNQCI